MQRKLQPADILEAIRALAAEGTDGASSSQVHARVDGSYATVGRLLAKLVLEKAIIRTGKARATRYVLAPAEQQVTGTLRSTDRITTTISPGWSAQARTLLDELDRPLGARRPVGYRRQFVDDYVPTESFLLPRELAEALAQEGRIQGQQPAGTYARKVLEQLLIDLSWSSSRLEGNSYSLQATEELFKSGASPSDPDAVMLLNHKRAIEFLVDAVPSDGLTDSVVRNVHALLMQDLLEGSGDLGAIRTRIVNITGTTYVPSQVPQLLEEMLSQIIGKAQLIKSPVEAAFFLWVNLAYLQPFEDGNKRTSRLVANIPLMLYNCAPLAFLDVDPRDYATAMLGIYEQLDLSVAVELFAWTYRRSIRRYRVTLEAMGSPDPFRVRNREQLSEAVQRIVRQGRRLDQVATDLGVPAKDADAFKAMLEAELDALTAYNCARYRVSFGEVQGWIDRGRSR